MPRIDPLSLDQAVPSVKATLKAVEGKLGTVPNLYATFAKSPAVLEAFLELSESLSKGRLSAAQREIVALAVGQANACQYCVSAHALVGRNAGLTETQVQEAREGRSVDPLDNAVARFAAKVITQRGIVSDDELISVQNAGLDDELILEVLANVALNVMTNYTNHIAQTDIDFPVIAL